MNLFRHSQLDLQCPKNLFLKGTYIKECQILKFQTIRISLAMNRLNSSVNIQLTTEDLLILHTEFLPQLFKEMNEKEKDHSNLNLKLKRLSKDNLDLTLL